MVRIILVRHGETEWNKERRLQGGGSDIPLNATGKLQAENAAIKLQNEKIQAIYSSPLQRALSTAQAISSYHKLEINLASSLKEIHVGALEGILSATLPQRFDELICQGKHLTLAGNNSECIRDVQNRAWETIQDIAGRYTGTVVVVTHYFVILTLIGKVLNLPLEQLSRLRSSPGTLTIFTLDGNGKTCLELFNDGYRIRPND